MSRTKADSQSEAGQPYPLQNQVNWSLVGGGVAAVFILAGLLLVGKLYSHLETRQLIAAMTPTMQMLGFATITATGTILALTLTMLGLIHQSELRFKHGFYESIRRISLLCTIDFICSVLLLSLVGIPFGESDTVPTLWLNALYFILIFANAIISGLLVTIILMLFDAVKGLISALKTD